MLPWEHLAVGYLGYSLWSHLRAGQRPAGLPVVILAVATQLPDLVDKPLGWWIGVLPSVGLGHSLFFAAPVMVLAWLLGGRRLGIPVVLGLGSHLLGDVFFKAVVGGSLEYAFLVWPLFDQPVSGNGGGEGLFSQVGYWIAHFLEFLTSSEGLAYLGFEVLLVGSALLLWIYDGVPGLALRSYRRRADASPE
jgi:hypothetical protein